MMKGIRNRVNSLLAERDHILKQVEEETTAVKQLQEELEHIQEAQKIIQSIAQGVQQQVHHRIAAVVTKCLQSVFPEDPYEFKIIFEQKRGKTEARLCFVRDGNEVDPTSASGGGCIDVAALALRLSCLILRRPHLRRLLVLDEPFRFLSPEYRELIPDLLMTLSEEMGVQIVMTTNNPEIATGKVIKIS